MIAFDKALQFVSANTARLSSINIDVVESIDRVLAQDVCFHQYRLAAQRLFSLTFH